MTSLMEQPCGERCNRNADYKITFIINSMTLADEEYYRNIEKIFTITWDQFVFRSKFTDSLNGEREELQIHCTPQQLNEKLKSCPMMMNISTEENDEIGTMKFPLSDCFCDAVLCKDFKLERLQNNFKFFQDEEESASVDIDLVVERVEMNENALEAVDKLTKELHELHTNESRTSSSSLFDDKSSELLYSEFACPDELSDECKRNLALGEHFYRIVNGHLVNVKEKRGFCGDICKVAKKYCRELKELPSSKPSSVDILKHFNKKPLEKVEVDCGMVLKKQESLNKICEFLKNRFKSTQKEKISKEKPKKVKSKRSTKNKKKPKKRVPKSSVETRPTANAQIKTFIEQTRRSAFKKYSYDYGDSYPFHRYGCNTPKPSESVPSNMGWRHDKLNLFNKSWYPGRINKTVRLLMKHHLSTYPYDTIPLSNANRRMEIEGTLDDDDNELKPTLRVMKHNGEISIEMRPIKEGKELETDCNPYLDCTPLKFIIKKRPEEIKLHKARMILKSRGFQRKCKCIDIGRCRCISQIQKLLFQDELKKVSKELAMKRKMEYNDVHDSSDSDIDFEFTPPTVWNSMPRCKPDVTHTGTQYDIKHFARKEIKFISKNKSLR